MIDRVENNLVADASSPSQKKILWLSKESKPIPQTTTPLQVNTTIPPINPTIAKRVAERLASGDKSKK